LDKLFKSINTCNFRSRKDSSYTEEHGLYTFNPDKRSILKSPIELVYNKTTALLDLENHRRTNNHGHNNGNNRMELRGDESESLRISVSLTDLNAKSLKILRTSFDHMDAARQTIDGDPAIVEQLKEMAEKAIANLPWESQFSIGFHSTASKPPLAYMNFLVFPDHQIKFEIWLFSGKFNEKNKPIFTKILSVEKMNILLNMKNLITFYSLYITEFIKIIGKTS
jgi:hypothetical protein